MKQILDRGWNITLLPWGGEHFYQGGGIFGELQTGRNHLPNKLCNVARETSSLPLLFIYYLPWLILYLRPSQYNRWILYYLFPHIFLWPINFITALSFWPAISPPPPPLSLSPQVSSISHMYTCCCLIFAIHMYIGYGTAWLFNHKVCSFSTFATHMYETTRVCALTEYRLLHNYLDSMNWIVNVSILIHVTHIYTS